jgi:glycosyltransferase involved in cell wall biosynthesis
VKICFVTPRVPPTKCGVGDYTWRLAGETAKTCEVFVVTSRSQTEAPRDERFTVVAEVPGWGPRGMLALWRIIRRIRPSWVSLQYVPYLYHRKGLNLWLPLLVLALRMSGVRVVLHVHEPFVALDTVKHVVAGLVQRLAFVLLVTGSRKVVLTIAAWTAMFRRWFSWRAADIFWLPVGSNIPRLEWTAEQRQKNRAELGAGPDDVVLAVMNPFGGGKLPGFIRDAWTAVAQHPRMVLLMIGAAHDQKRRDEGEPPRSAAIIYTGYVSPENVSKLLSCTDVFMAPFVDGISARRTSALCAMEHGLPVVTTRGHLTDPGLFDQCPAVLTSAAASDDFRRAVVALVESRSERKRLGDDAARFFSEHFTLSVLAQRMLEELQPSARPSGPRRILYISPVGERGGAETTLLNLLRHHDRRRFAPQVAVLKAGPLVAEIAALDVPTTVIPVARLRRMTDTVPAILALRRIIQRDQIDVVFGNMSMGHVFGSLARLGTGAKAVWFQHGIVDRPDTVDRLAARLPASLMFCHSKSVAAAQHRLGPRAGIVIVPGGIDPDGFASYDERGDFRRELGLAEDAFVISCIGRLQEGKGQRFLLGATAPLFRDDKNVHLVIVGSTQFGLEGDYPAALRAEAAQLPDPTRIHFLGQRSDVGRILRDTDLLVHCPVSPESFGYVIVEAMAMGVPVVASRAGGPEEIVVGGETGLLVPVGDVGALGRAIESLLADPERRRAMGQAGRRRVLARFTADRMTAEVEGSLQGLLAR